MRALLAVVLWSLPALAAAAIFQCPTVDGGVTFQDVPCPVAPRSERANASMSETRQASRIVRPPPAGIHPSWFEVPENDRHEAFCHRDGCECGALRRPFDSGLALAVADALYLDGHWHRYESALAEWQAATANSPEFFTWLDAVQEASCDVRMSQETLRRFLLDALRDLKEVRYEAESFGYTDIDDCVIEEPASCDYVDKVLLYDRMMDDLQTLQQARGAGFDDLVDTQTMLD